MDCAVSGTPAPFPPPPVLRSCPCARLPLRETDGGQIARTHAAAQQVEVTAARRVPDHRVLPGGDAASAPPCTGTRLTTLRQTKSATSSATAASAPWSR